MVYKGGWYIGHGVMTGKKVFSKGGLVNSVCKVHAADPTKHIWWNSETGLCHTCGLPHPGAKREAEEVKAKTQYVPSNRFSEPQCTLPLIHGRWDRKTGRCLICGWPHPHASITRLTGLTVNYTKKEVIPMDSELNKIARASMKDGAFPKEMWDKHIKRHEMLHKHLDELGSDFLIHNPDELLSDTSVVALLTWSYSQTLEPKWVEGEQHMLIAEEE